MGANGKLPYFPLHFLLSPSHFSHSLPPHNCFSLPWPPSLHPPPLLTYPSHLNQYCQHQPERILGKLLRQMKLTISAWSATNKVSRYCVVFVFYLFMFLALTKLLVLYQWSLTQYISILCWLIWWMALSLILLCCRALELTGTCVCPPACTGLTLWTGGKGRSLDCTAYTLGAGCQSEYCTAQDIAGLFHRFWESSRETQHLSCFKQSKGYQMELLLLKDSLVPLTGALMSQRREQCHQKKISFVLTHAPIICASTRPDNRFFFVITVPWPALLISLVSHWYKLLP